MVPPLSALRCCPREASRFTVLKPRSSRNCPDSIERWSADGLDARSSFQEEECQ